jgi:hypothetical protein
MIADRNLHGWVQLHVKVTHIPGCQTNLSFYPLIAFLLHGLRASAGTSSVTSDILQINRRCDHFDIVERELGSLSQHLSVDDDEG